MVTIVLKPSERQLILQLLNEEWESLDEERGVAYANDMAFGHIKAILDHQKEIEAIMAKVRDA